MSSTKCSHRTRMTKVCGSIRMLGFTLETSMAVIVLTIVLKKEGNGVYAFVLEGEVEVNGEQLSKRDGMGIWDTDSIAVKTAADSRVLLMEVPMSI